MSSALQLDVPELEEIIVPQLDEVEARLMEVVSNADETINPPTSHLAAAGGKRLRPMLVLLTAQLGDAAAACSQQVHDAAVAVELTHIATLYHDDVMDDAPKRRGAPSAQMVWGNSAAILTGDILVARASQMVAALGPDAVLAHARTFERLCTGQLHETLPRPEGVDPVDHYIQVLADKTGSLIALCGLYGTMLTGAGAKAQQIVELYGEKIGVAFQLADDVIDICSDSETTGKTPGTDSAGQAILSLLSTGNVQRQQVLSDVVQRLRNHPVTAETRAMAGAWCDEAVAALADLDDAVVEATRTRLEAEGLSEAEVAQGVESARSRAQLVRRGLEDFAHLLVDRAA